MNKNHNSSGMEAQMKTPIYKHIFTSLNFNLVNRAMNGKNLVWIVLSTKATFGSIVPVSQKKASLMVKKVPFWQ